jgi:hypothetical protein
MDMPERSLATATVVGRIQAKVPGDSFSNDTEKSYEYPAKLPLDETVLGKLAEAHSETGLPQSQLLLTSLRTATSRKRRLPKRKR